MLILGVNSFFEHPSAVLISDGRILFAAEDERFTSIKHGCSYSPWSRYIPFRAINAGLLHIGATSADVEEISYSYDRRTHLRSVLGSVTGKRISPLRDELSAFASLMVLPRAIQGEYGTRKSSRDIWRPDDVRRVPFRSWNHHLCHAASAYYCSDFEDAVIIVADAAGERACTSVYRGTGDRINFQSEHRLPNSLGHFYSMITSHLGFEPFGDEFKVMGLAAYGEPRFAEVMATLVRIGPDGTYTIDLARFGRLDDILPRGRADDGSLTNAAADVARSAQDRLEEVIEHIVRHAARTTGARNLCLAGGTFMNCVANGRIAGLGLFDGIFVQPAASDAGTAIGAAALSAARRGSTPRLATGSFALGTAHADAAIREELDRAGLAGEECNDGEWTDRLAEQLAQDRICAVFRGRMEFGPRALGHRSLLASPIGADMARRLNYVKQREDFRPVAPMVTEEAFDRYFSGQRNRYMSFTCASLPGAAEAIPSAIHADGSARAQTVRADEDADMHAVLTAFGRRTGHPVVINTSFNVRGRPIVESPAEAISCFLSSGIDCLVIGRYVVKKSA